MRSFAVFPFGLILAASLVAPPNALALEGRYVIVRTDGTTMTMAAAPVRKGATYVGRLLRDGQLVSFPASEVDQAKTDEANQVAPSQAAGSRPPVLKRATPRPEPPRLKVPRSDAERTLASSSGTASTSAPVPPPPSADMRAGAPAPNPVDRQGHGEAWWRKRAAPILSRVARADAEQARTAAARDAHERSPGVGTPAWQIRLNRLRSAEEKARAHVDEEKRALDRLAEEARRADAYPGWIR